MTQTVQRVRPCGRRKYKLFEQQRDDPSVYRDIDGLLWSILEIQTLQAKGAQCVVLLTCAMNGGKG